MSVILIFQSFSMLILEKISKLSFILFNLLICLSFNSCKTIEIDEKQVFKESKYNYERIASFISSTNYTQSKKDSLLSIYNTIINTNDKQILSASKVNITRNFLKVDTLDLEYFIFQPEKTEKIGLFFIGNTSSIPNFRDELIRLSNQSNSKIYVLNYRGYGKSNGIPKFKDQFSDNNFFLNEILKIEKKVNYVIGYSLGTVFATRLATENSIEKLFLLSPFSNAEEIIAHQKKVFTRGPKIIFRPFIKLKTEEHLLSISNTEQVKKFKGNLIIFHGTNDQTLPYKMGVNLYENSTTSTKKIYTLKKGGHRAPFNDENWSKLIEEIKI